LPKLQPVDDATKTVFLNWLC